MACPACGGAAQERAQRPAACMLWNAGIAALHKPCAQAPPTSAPHQSLFTKDTSSSPSASATGGSMAAMLAAAGCWCSACTPRRSLPCVQPTTPSACPGAAREKFVGRQAMPNALARDASRPHHWAVWAWRTAAGAARVGWVDRPAARLQRQVGREFRGCEKAIGDAKRMGVAIEREGEDCPGPRQNPVYYSAPGPWALGCSAWYEGPGQIRLEMTW